jgi:hypothetical protein
LTHARRVGAAAVLFWLLAAPLLAQPAPSPLTVLDVPFISQSEALCGGAAAAMVLRYWGERGLAAESFAHLVDRSAAGIRTDVLVGDLRARGWNATGIKGTGADIGNELARGRPVLALIEDRPGTFHYIVIVAATPRALVFHDPARAPTRVVASEEFARRWDAADRWMAVIVPGAPGRAADVQPPDPASPATRCEELIARGVADARADDLGGAERALTSALACKGSAAARELAGVRLLQRRWPDVEALAATAVSADPGDTHAWRLLGTSRFVQNDAEGALEAWNRAGEPRVDLIRVDGLVRSRQRVVENLLGVDTGSVLSSRSLIAARRRLQQLPVASSTRLTYVPVPSGLAELRAAINERPLVPTDVWSYAALGGIAAARREVGISLGAPTGAGELLTGTWRFWTNRPAAHLELEAPAPWGGTWAADAGWERQTFDVGSPSAERIGVALTVSNWVAPLLRLSARLGADEWKGVGRFGRVGATVGIRSLSDRVEIQVTADAWLGAAAFSRFDAGSMIRSRADRGGLVYVARGGLSAATLSAPPDMWFGGDTGDARPVLLRAHPLIEDGRLQTNQLGRRLVHASTEAQYWWPVSALRVGAALFADAARVEERLATGGQGDVDVGAGLRLAAPGLPGTFRLEVAKGLRDGATAASFVYDALGW